jgi:hypothetical protein
MRFCVAALYFAVSGFDRGDEEACGCTGWEEGGCVAAKDNDDVCLGGDGEMGEQSFFRAEEKIEGKMEVDILYHDPNECDSPTPFITML